MVVDLCIGADRGAGVAGIDFLLDGDGGRDAGDQVHVRLAHAAEELAGEGGEAFGKAALAFGEQGVEGERTFAAAGDAGDDHQLSERNIQVDILQVVNPGASYVYLLCLHLFLCAGVPS